MTIVINLLWSIILLILLIVLTYLFEFKIGSDHKFISLLLMCLGVTLMINGYFGSFKSIAAWMCMYLMVLLFADTFIASFFLSLQITTLSMFGLSFLPKFSYTWSKVIGNYLLGKVGIIISVIMVIVFILGTLASSDNDNTKNNLSIESNSDNNEFQFADGYNKGFYNEDIYYSLYSTNGNNATLKDDQGNIINVYIWNKEEGILKDNQGNLYYTH